VKNSAQPKPLSVRDERELMSLRDLSARVGNDSLLAQASNGNTSIKLDGILWIKASGKWLSHAMQEEMLVPLELAEVKESIRTGAEIASRYAQKDELRPSIETAMHALLRHRVVIHVHSINAIAWAIRVDGPDQLRERLAGLQWQWIPYAASGIPLAQAIEKAMATAPETDVFILGNHGLVVCGQDCHTVEKLLRDGRTTACDCSPSIPKARHHSASVDCAFLEMAISRCRFVACTRHRCSVSKDSKRRRSLSMPGHFSGPDCASIPTCGCRFEIHKALER